MTMHYIACPLNEKASYFYKCFKISTHSYVSCYNKLTIVIKSNANYYV